MRQPDALPVCEFSIIHAAKTARYETAKQKQFFERLQFTDGEEVAKTSNDANQNAADDLHHQLLRLAHI